VRFLAVLSLALIAILDSRAQGLIGSTDRFVEQTETPGASWAIAFDHVSDPFFLIPPTPNPATRIFSMTLSTNDAGHTFFANALNEPAFGGFVAGLTDGSNDIIRLQVPGIWYVPDEQRFLGRSSLSPDLAGYNITQIGFRVTAFYDWYEPVEERNFRTLNYSLDFYGAAVPEPSMWALLALGSASALLLRRKASRR
jgi:hypothetical protein